MKKILALVLACCMVFALCAVSASADSKGSVYYLNFKPEADEAWQSLAKVYTEQTGVPVTVLTAASGSYEETLTAEMAKSSAPTLFQVNGPVGLANWTDYALDLSGTALDKELTSDAFELRDGDEVKGIGYVIETYGIIVNTALLKQAGYTVADITNFESLKAVVEDITARKDELGFAAFTSAGMDSSSDWRFKTHLANLPIYAEYQADGIGSTEAIKGSFLDNYKAIWDLYINNATCAPAELAGKTGNDAVAEFVNGEGVFYQNGTWAYNDIKEIGDENLQMIPIYIGLEGEENQGLTTGTENYWCVNADASEDDIQATLDFLYWVVTSEEGTSFLAENIGVCPFKAAKESANPFVAQDAAYTAEGKVPVTWCFTTIPSEAWKDGVGSALTAYAAGTGDWEGVVTAFVDGWAKEYALNN